MKWKLWLVRGIGVVGICVVIGLGVMEYLNGTLLENLPRMILVLVSMVLVVVRTFVGRVNGANRRDMNDTIEKNAEPFRMDPKAKKLFARGMRGVYSDHFPLAYTYLEKAYQAAEAPRAKARAAFYMGSCSLAQKKYNQALDYLEDASRLDPGYAGIWSQLYTVYMAVEQPEKARAACEAGLTYSPQSTPLLSRLGSYYMLAGDYENALKMHGEALRLEPTNPVSCANVALAHAGLGDRAAAEEYLAKAQRMGYKNAAGAREEIDRLLELVP